MRGGVSCSVHQVTLETGMESRQQLILRRYGDNWAEDPAVSGREFRLLQVLSEERLPVPKPYLHDEATATLVMARLPGRATLQPRNLPSYLTQLAESLAHVHRQPTEGLQFLPRVRKRDERLLGYGPRTDDPLYLEVWAEVQRLAPAIPDGKSLVHGDFWPGNTIWFRDRLSGVIDWEMAGLGNPARDVATCRCDLSNLFDLSAADTFTKLYEQHTGEPARDLRFWDLFICTGALRYMEDWSRGYRDLGRKELTAEEAKRRVAAFARAALAAPQD